MTAARVSERVREVIAEVLVVPRAAVHDDAALVGELGAESIDFLDLVFRLEETLGVRIPIERWDAYVRDRMAGRADYDRVTPAFVEEFVTAIMAGETVDARDAAR